MKYIISGTNRPDSRTLEVSRILQSLYQTAGEMLEIIDLCHIDLELCTGQDYGSKELPSKMRDAVDKITNADGLVIVCPEYNGSMPGALKTYIDYWKYPDSFDSRPVAFVGLGGRFGGVRPVEHLQGVLGYRNAYCFPTRVFLSDIWTILKDGQIQDPRLLALMQAQASSFLRFCRALKNEGLDANSLRQSIVSAAKP